MLLSVRAKVDSVLETLKPTNHYPLAETMMMIGFFLTVFVEQAVLTFRKEKPSFIDLETFNAGVSAAGSDSENDAPFIAPARGSRDHQYHSHHHGHFHPTELTHAGPLRLASLVLALSAHSVFEGLALGLQKEGAELGTLFIGVAIHETLAALALGASPRDAGKLAVTVSLMIPLGIGIGMGIQTVQHLAESILSVVLQGLAASTFLFVTFFEILSRELEDKHDRLLKVLFLALGYSVLAGLIFTTL
ncbi:zinc transporter ZIP3 [Cyprinus carpio]|uniref:Zinc transporter ZIP3 n=1 Tax=Cyprinus carpio TaxID=7962 RepID=A0A9Q9WVN3_CYPCA|nr:zinc transporter ZIP3 [Cyprinus carpio]